MPDIMEPDNPLKAVKNEILDDICHAAYKTPRIIVDVIDNTLYGRDEDAIVRHARRVEFDQRYGNLWLATLVPGLMAYRGIRADLKNPELTKPEKAARCALELVVGVSIEATRFFGIYFSYQMYSHMFFS